MSSEKLAASSTDMDEFIEFLELRFENPYLEAKAPNKLFPNYAECVAAEAAQFRMAREIKRFLAKKSK